MNDSNPNVKEVGTYGGVDGFEMEHDMAQIDPSKLKDSQIIEVVRIFNALVAEKVSPKVIAELMAARLKKLPSQSPVVLHMRGYFSLVEETIAE